MRAAFLLAAFAILLTSPAGAVATDPLAASDFVLPDSLFHPALAAAGLKPVELDCFPDYNTRDIFRLELVDALMRDPASSDSLLAPILAALTAPEEEDPLGIPAMSDLARFAEWMDLPAVDSMPWQNFQMQMHVEQSENPQSPDLYFGILVEDLRARRAHALADLNRGERDWLRRESPRLMDELADADQIHDPLILRRLENALSARGDSTLALWARVDRRDLLAQGEAFARRAAWYAQIMAQQNYGDEDAAAPSHPDGHRFADGSVAEGTLLYAAESEYGNLVVGGAAANRYRGDFLFILDLGGDDGYALTSAWPDEGEDLLESRRGWRCVYDLAGNDDYLALEDGALASGCLGAGLLVDESGDDRYRAQSFDLGCGWLGVGLLFDRDGDDSYRGDRVVMGAGGAGCGLLRDEAGQDLYRAHLYAQGFAYVGGLGLLEDRRGSDLYAAMPKYTDILRYEDHSLTLSQGFSIGARPHHSGGIGILFDAEGNDSYLADIYGQGSSYWYSLGLLWDRRGNDRYEAYQYAQGAGIHLAVAYLLDDGGNDSYSSHGVGQGCGHDLAFGLLRDGAGNDRYSCDDLSQGAGSANGIGVLLDAAGLDGYLSKSHTAPAYGNPRRHFGSLGLTVDGSGDDWGSVPLQAGEKRGSLLGLWLDRDRPQAGPVWDPGAALPYEIADRTWEEYFLLASSGEPRFRDWRRAGFDSLVAHPAAAIPVLLEHLDTDDARERHTLKDLFREMGEPAVNPLREVLREGPPTPWRVAAWCLEHIRNPRAQPELMGLLASPRDWRDQVAALAALARLEGLDDEERNALEASCRRLALDEATHSLVLKEIAYLMGEQDLAETELLLGLVMAEHYAPRWMAVTALKKRQGWGRTLARVWTDELAAYADDSPSATASRRLALLCSCLPLRPAGELRPLIRQARRAGCLEETEFAQALLRALQDHPRSEGPAVKSSLRKLQEAFPEIRPLR